MIQLQCEAIPTGEFTKMADIHIYIHSMQAVEWKEDY